MNKRRGGLTYQIHDDRSIRDSNTVFESGNGNKWTKRIEPYTSEEEIRKTGKTMASSLFVSAL